MAILRIGMGQYAEVAGMHRDDFIRLVCGCLSCGSTCGCAIWAYYLVGFRETIKSVLHSFIISIFLIEHFVVVSGLYTIASASSGSLLTFIMLSCYRSLGRVVQPSRGPCGGISGLPRETKASLSSSS
ncbi:hypothetical protein BDY21DRAFT_354803 [Lineolata rhizophorae]|uniref:Uncharacterized protein n=1 Tax=Lineolata rhizophorae TaxID=578093 RepID=A0A6A6NPQ7_9PEZI|nr:hypothetical protein BDY21DRAFT_354803 [Lineolata rhizophorae]